MSLHSLRECCWLRRSGDMICSDYDKDANHELNSLKSYCELAVKTMCRCIPSWSLLKHGALKDRDTSYYGHSHDDTLCKLSHGSCGYYCGACVHYCGIQHGA